MLLPKVVLEIPLQVFMKEKTTTCTQRVYIPANHATNAQMFPHFTSSTSHDLVHHQARQRKHALIESSFRALVSAALPGHGKAEGEFSRTSAIWMCDEEEKNNRGGKASIYTHSRDNMYILIPPFSPCIRTHAHQDTTSHLP
jgi:hypothetical protein